MLKASHAGKQVSTYLCKPKCLYDRGTSFKLKRAQMCFEAGVAASMLYPHHLIRRDLAGDERLATRTGSDCFLDILFVLETCHLRY